MSDEHGFEGENDDPLARIRARFEQASERILSGVDDDSPEVAGSAAPVATTDLAAPDDVDPLEDFGQIDIKHDARFSLDFEHGVSTRPASQPAVLPSGIDIAANLEVIRDDSPDRAATAVDPERHAKHRTRGRIEHGSVARAEMPPPPLPVKAAPAVEEPSKKARKSKKKDKTPEQVPVVPAPVVTDAPVAVQPEPEVETDTEPDAPVSRMLLLVLALLFVSAAGVATYFLASSPDETAAPAAEPTTTSSTTLAPATPTAAAAVALDAFGFAGVQVGVDEQGVATLVGKVRSAKERDIAVEIVADIEGVTSVVTDLTYTSNRPAADIQADAEDEIAGSVYPIAVVVTEGIARVTGIVPVAAMQSGALSPGGTVETRLLSVDGVEEVRLELTPRGDADRLTASLVELLTTTPIVFDAETGERPAESDATLDAIVELALEEPGVTLRVAVRGDADDETLGLAELRREEILSFLAAAGVDPDLLETALVASLGEATQAVESDVLIEAVDRN